MFSIKILVFLAVNAIVSWLIKLARLFLSVPANHKPSILSNDKSGLASCWYLTMRVGALPANPPSQ